MKQPLTLNQAVGALGRYSLVTVTADSLTVHRLVQTVVRSSVTPEDWQLWAVAAIRLINAAFPSTSDVENWPASALLLPHVLAVVGHAEALDGEAQTTASLCMNAGFYLWARGQYRQALPLEEQALAARRRVLGEDHPDTLGSMHNLAETRRDLGDLDDARALHEQALAGRRQVLGDEYPDTLTSLNNLAAVRRELGEL